MKFTLSFCAFLWFTACSSPPPPPVENDYKSILSSHDPLTDAQLEQALALLHNDATLPAIRGYLFERLSTEEYARFHQRLGLYGRPIPLGDGTEYIPCCPPRLEDISLSPNHWLETEALLMYYHDPGKYGYDEWTYIERMLDFMELPIPYNRKINGLLNIQRVMAESETYNDLNDPEMEEIRNRLYQLAIHQNTPGNLRRGLAEWLREIR